jgi:hypothetical protein
MKRAFLLLAAIAAVGVSPSPVVAGEAPWRPHVHDAQVYAGERRGTIAFHVRTPTREWGSRASQTFPSASVLKAMLMDAYLNRSDVRSRSLRSADRALLEPMIRRSDNATASRIMGLVGTRGLRRVARRARMTRFTPASPIWGLSRVTPEDQTRYFLRVRSLLPSRHRAYGMKLLASVVESQRWGIGRVSLPGWEVYFKGGWGSGTGAVDHQVALLERDGTQVSVAVMTVNQGTHAYGKETLRGVFKRLLRGLPREGAVP